MSDRLLQVLERIQSAQLNARTTSALNPVLWLVATLSTSVAVSAAVGAVWWVTALLASGVGLSVLVTLGLAVFFAVKAPDALRSERYVIQKMAIERGALGDSVVGLISGEAASEQAQLSERSESDA